MEFLQLMESIRAGENHRAGLLNEPGQRAGQRRGPGYDTALKEAADMLARVFKGTLPTWRLSEAMGTADFPYLFGDILDRQIYGNYAATPNTWSNWCRKATVSDFRSVRRMAVNGGEAVLTTVAEQAPYPAASLSDARYTYNVAKYGRVMPFSWEAMINDDLDALKDVPKRFGKAAARTEEKFATALLADASGPHASFFTSGNANIVTANPALSVAGLQTAFTKLAAQTDSDGEPITIQMVELIVPPALMITAQNILNATELWLNEAGGSANQQVHTVNWMRQHLRLNVNPYLPVVSSTANGNTSWYMVANPEDARPAFELGFLRGHEAPELFIKTPNAQRVGGGAAQPMDGDFDTDSVEYKIRHVLGGVQADPKMAVASNGTGS